MEWNQFWTYFGRVDNLLGIATVVFAGYAASRLWQQNKRFRELAKRFAPIENFKQLLEVHQGVKSSSPVAFALCLFDKNESIRKSVETFLATQDWKMPIEELNMNGLNSPEDLNDYVTSLREKRRYFEQQGYTEIHLFVAGPVQAGTIIGSLYRNWIPIKLYHKPSPQPPQVYEYWMPLV
jgi:hypothetical protein